MGICSRSFLLRLCKFSYLLCLSMLATLRCSHREFSRFICSLTSESSSSLRFPSASRAAPARRTRPTLLWWVVSSTMYPWWKTEEKEMLHNTTATEWRFSFSPQLPLVFLFSRSTSVVYTKWYKSLFLAALLEIFSFSPFDFEVQKAIIMWSLWKEIPTFEQRGSKDTTYHVGKKLTQKRKWHKLPWFTFKHVL